MPAHRWVCRGARGARRDPGGKAARSSAVRPATSWSSRLKGLQARFPAIGEVRGLGAMVAIELVKNRRPDSPDADLTKALVQAAARRGARDPGVRHERQRHPLPGAPDHLGRPAQGRDEPVRTGLRRRRRLKFRVGRKILRGGRPRRGPILGVAGLSGPAGIRIRRRMGSTRSQPPAAQPSFLSSAIRPSAVLIGMQS